MTTKITTASLEEIDAALAAAGPDLDEGEQRLATAVLRLLSAGAPVSPAAAAAVAGLPAAVAGQALRSWSGVFWDDQGQVTGFLGLALTGMPHRVHRAGTDLGAWCAYDPLFLARVVGDLDIATADPVTGQAISYHIGRNGAISDASHPGSVLSFLRPGQPWGDDVIASFCHYVWHFTGPATAQRWTALHPGTFVISLDTAIELARRHAARAFGAASI
jgi:alkylmercury lyase-like protein